MDENIIKNILEIDKNAKAKINEAENSYSKIIAEAKAEKKRIVNDGIKEAEKSLKKLEDDERRRTDAELDRLKAKRDEETARLERIFEAHHAEWEENIFRAVING